jgi:hypothetical protein
MSSPWFLFSQPAAKDLKYFHRVMVAVFYAGTASITGVLNPSQKRFK